MHAIVNHQINKPEEFLAIVKAGGNFPQGFEVLAFLPDISHKSAICIWEAPDTKSLQNLIEPLLGDTCTNTYLEIDETLSMGLAPLKEGAVM